MGSVAPEIRDAVEAILERRVVAWQSVGGGFTNAENGIVTLDDGRSAFVKAATDDVTRTWLQREYGVYSLVSGSFMPKLLGWEDGSISVLVLEDLSGAAWPPPWSSDSIAAVNRALDDLHEVSAPRQLQAADELAEFQEGWDLVSENPDPLLGLGVCSRAWLADALPVLRAAAREVAIIDGDALVHLDIRSDNLCIRDGRCLIVDWSHATAANPAIDTAVWLPSLAAEGVAIDEPAPGSDVGALVAMFAGYLASRAGLPEPLTAPPHGVRPIQLELLRVALPIGVGALRLPPVT